MSGFEGFYSETTEILMGIRLNNNKEWFGRHRDDYKKFIHDPTTALGEEIFRELKKFDKSFDDIPKVSRANRDIRFSKEKLPYKESKWIIFRKDLTPNIMHENPTFFFELFPENYRFGLGFWSSPKGMADFRGSLDAAPEEAEQIINEMENLRQFTFEAEYYKRKFAGDRTEDLAKWYNCKWFNYICYRDNDELLLKKELAEFVIERFKQLYPVYKFLNRR